jgi:hypothetical protein
METKIETPKAPSQTLKVKNIIEKYNSKFNRFKNKKIKKNKDNTINSKLNKVDNKCLRLETKAITPIKNKYKINNHLKIINISFNNLTKISVL